MQDSWFHSRIWEPNKKYKQSSIDKVVQEDKHSYHLRGCKRKSLGKLDIGFLQHRSGFHWGTLRIFHCKEEELKGDSIGMIQQFR